MKLELTPDELYTLQGRGELERLRNQKDNRIEDLQRELRELQAAMNVMSVEHRKLRDQNWELVAQKERGSIVELVSGTKILDFAGAALSNQKIRAIKLYKDLTGAGLRESKDAVETLSCFAPHPQPITSGERPLPASWGQPRTIVAKTGEFIETCAEPDSGEDIPF